MFHLKQKIEFDDSLKPGEQKVTQEGEPGKKSRDITLTIQDGKVTNTEEGEFTQTKAPKAVSYTHLTLPTNREV